MKLSFRNCINALFEFYKRDNDYCKELVCSWVSTYQLYIYLNFLKILKLSLKHNLSLAASTSTLSFTTRYPIRRKFDKK